MSDSNDTNDDLGSPHDAVTINGEEADSTPRSRLNATVPVADRELERAVETSAVTINGKRATSVLYERSDEPTPTYALTWKDSRRIVAKIQGAGDRELVDALGQVNADAIKREGKGRLVGEQLRAHDGTGAEVSPPSRRKKAPAIESNVVEPVMIDPREAIERAENHRRRELAEYDQSVKSAAANAPTLPSDSRPGGASAATLDNQAGDDEVRRRAAVLEDVRTQFQVKGDRYRFKDGDRALAFRESESKLTSASNDTRAARAVAAMADGKGWTSIKVAGHEDFRREVWIEASARGLDVRGYKPTEQDQQQSDERARVRLPNAVEPVQESRARDSATERPTTREDTRAATPSPAPAPSAARAPDKLRTHEGVLLEHGAAPYRHDPKEKGSYFAKLETGEGERTVWGKDLERVIEAGGFRAGTRVTLANVGRELVTVTELERDGSGKVTGRRQVQSHLNRWEARGADRASVVESISSKLIDERVSDPELRATLKAAFAEELDNRERAGTTPAVPMYDRQANSRETERSIDTGKSSSQERTR